MPGGANDAFTSKTIDYIGRCTGIMFLIDPDETWTRAEEVTGGQDLEGERQGKYYTIINSIFNRIEIQRKSEKGATPTKVYIAFCLTKMDKYGLQQVDVKAFAKKIIGTFAIRRIEQFCRTNPHISERWFSTSAIGVMRNHDRRLVSRLDTDTGRVIDPHKIEPYGIRDALEWLLNSASEDRGRKPLWSRLLGRLR